MCLQQSVCLPGFGSMAMRINFTHKIVRFGGGDDVSVGNLDGGPPPSVN